MRNAFLVKNTKVHVNIPYAQLIFPPSLTARQRATIHDLGDAYGLLHESSGDGRARRIVLGSFQKDAVEVPCPDDSPLSDEDLADFIHQHLLLDPTSIMRNRSPRLNSSLSSDNPLKSSERFLSRTNDRQNGIRVAFPSHQAIGPMDIGQFTASMQALLELERCAELETAQVTLSELSPEKAESRGRAIYNLRLSSAEGGLLGRTLLTLVRNKRGANGEDILPEHKFSPHDVVRIRPSRGDGNVNSPTLTEGVVYRVKETSITIAVEEMPDEGLDVPLRLEKLANEITYGRLKSALQVLDELGSTGRGAASSIVDVLFARRSPRFSPASSEWISVNKALDDSQRKAVDMCLSSEDVSIVHGPPGTGKTTAVVEIIAQEVLRGSRVLACAASNIAVDNLTERLTSQSLPGGKKINVVRIGHPARLLPQVLEASLEAKVLSSDDSSLAADCRKEIKDINARLLKLSGRDRMERQRLRRELRQLVKEERARQEKALKNVLQSAQVVCATLTGVGVRHIAELPSFDIVVIDEAAQALEPACWAALLRGRRALLAGDHLQLPPTVISEEAARRGLSKTLFERMHEMYGDRASIMLTQQYRMNQRIMAWSSNEMYHGKLHAHSSVAHHTLSGLVLDDENAATLPVLLLIDTAGCDMQEQSEEDGESRFNREEAAVTMKHVERLLKYGVRPQDIGVITPYAAQVNLLRELRAAANQPLIEISTVDGFQGREKEAIVISAVRSNDRREVGFLAESRRMNVAVTRARRHCALVLDSDTVRSEPFLDRLVTYFEDHGDYMSAAELEMY